MADAITLQDAGNIVAFIAPGYFAYATYRRRFPERDRPAGELLVLSVVLSLPFVSFARYLAPQAAADATSARFVIALLAPPILAGFLYALIRGSEPVRAVLSHLDYSEQPEGSMWLRTLQYLPDDAWVTVLLKNGTELSGVVSAYPGLPQDGVNELYLTHPHWITEDGTVQPSDGQGVIVRLDDASAITLSVDPVSAVS